VSDSYKKPDVLRIMKSSKSLVGDRGKKTNLRRTTLIKIRGRRGRDLW